VIALNNTQAETAVAMVRLAVERGWIGSVANAAELDGLKRPVVVLATHQAWQHLGLDAVAPEVVRELPTAVGQCQWTQEGNRKARGDEIVPTKKARRKREAGRIHRLHGCPRFRVVAIPEAALPPLVVEAGQDAAPSIAGWQPVVAFAHGGRFSATVRRTGTDANTTRCTT